MTFHDGELVVQKQAGVEEMAAKVGRSIHSFIPPAAADFIARQPMAFVGFRSDDGNVWASVLTGRPGQFSAKDERTVRLDSSPGPSDPLQAAWRNGRSVGLLFIETATRRRMRANGRLNSVTDHTAEVVVAEVYANCPKYIQAREWRQNNVEGVREPSTTGSELTERQRQWIIGADTFFIASAHTGGGSDVSHRGGNPGFVLVDDSSHLSFPDYAGNNMFNTLGNLALDPQAGLLFMDYTSGTTLQLSGVATISWEKEKIHHYPGAERVIDFEVRHVVETPAMVGLNWQYLEPSPFNPK